MARDGRSAVWVPGPQQGTVYAQWTGGDWAVTCRRAKEWGQFSWGGALEEAMVSVTSHHLQNGKHKCILCGFRVRPERHQGME